MTPVVSWVAGTWGWRQREQIDAMARLSAVGVGLHVSHRLRWGRPFADLDASTWVMTSGTSGHPTSRHYADQIGAWARGETFPWPFTREAVDADAAATLTLTPGE